MSTLLPAFTVKAIIVESKQITSDSGVRYQVDFACDAINKFSGKSTLIPSELVAQMGGCLSIKVKEDMYRKIRHMLNIGSVVDLTVSPSTWLNNGNAGTFFEFIEMEPAVVSDYAQV